MKKLNKKGVTLIELIVSFAIVSIAMIYFYQTIVDLHRMYKNSNKATDEFVKKDYALRVLDAWATKPGNDLSSLPSGFCTTYSLFCNNVTTSTELYYKTATLTDGKISVIYYKANKTLYQINIESKEIFDSDGNIINYTILTNAMNSLNASDKLSVTFDNENKITYKITNSSGTELYSKTNSKSINKVINDLSDQTEETIKEKVQELVGTEYTIEESVEEIETGVYASVYNIVDKNGNAVATNIYKTNDLIRYDNKNASADIKNLFNEINPNGTYDFIYNNHINEFYSLKFELTSTENEWCYAVLCNGLRGSCADGNDYYVDYYLHEIKNSDILEELVKQNKINVKTETIETGKYYLTYSKFKNNSGTDLDNHYIKVYNFAGTKNACKMKLVEAYKYKY